MGSFFTGRGPFRVTFALVLALFVGAAASVLLGRGQAPAATPQNAVEATEGRPPTESDLPEGAQPLLPVQPIAFSHRHHVTEIGLDCQTCHVYARRSPVAGIPSVETCIGCHAQVLTERPEIQKLLAFWENKEPIPWVRVHDLPDYARFSHKRHVLGGLACADCHGDVAQMEIAEQRESLSMGWCVSCHKERDASIDCLTCHY